MKVGLQNPSFSFAGGTTAIGPMVGEIARRADAAGFASFWVMDHFFQIEMAGRPEEPMLEGYSTLSFVAGQTERIRLGTLVTGVTYRYPGLLAKTVTTLDVLSGGRAYLGIGAAWYEREHLALGVPYPPTAERFERLEEALRIVRQMWSDDDGPFEGRYYQLAETMNHPQVISRPHPPIMIGGSGERKTLRLVAQYADACNLFSSPELAHKLDVLKRHCEAVGRDYADIEKTTILGVQGVDDAAAMDGLLETIRGQGALGIDHVILSLPAVDDPGYVDLLGERVVGPAAGIVPAGR